jgi:molecular chaperone GrpE (heat shock protein)
MGEVARLQMEIRGRKQRATELAEEMKRKVGDIKNALLTAEITKPENLRLGLVAELSAKLEKLQEEYLQLQREIEILEKELS